MSKESKKVSALLDKKKKKTSAYSSLTNLSRDFKLLVNNKMMSDITFIVENKKIYLHKSILCIRSKYVSLL